MAQQPAIPGVGEDVTDLMPVGADVSALMGGGAPQRPPTPVQDALNWAGRQTGEFLFGSRADETAPRQGGVLAAIDPRPALDLVGELVFDPLTTPTKPGEMPMPKLGTKGVEFITNVLQSHAKQIKQFWDMEQKGDPRAMQHLRAALIPILGPQLEEMNAARERGEISPSSQLGFTLASVGQMLLPKEAPITPGITPRLSPAMEKAVALGTREGIDMPIGVVTGSRFLKGGRQLAEESIFGGKAQEESLRQVGQLQDKARQFGTTIAPKPATPMSAGVGVYQGTLAKEKQLAGQASERYQTFEQAANAPGLLTEVERTPEAMARLRAQRSQNMREAFGDKVPTREELNELALIRTEMDELRYQRGGQVDISKRPERGYQGIRIDEKYVPPVAGAEVIHDINKISTNLSEVSRPDAIRSLDTALTEGKFDETARAALDVVRHRMKGEWGTVSKPPMPSSYAVMPEIPKTEMIQAPVDFRTVKETLRPALERLEKQPGWAQRQMDPAAQALRSIVEGPDYRPVTETNDLLSALKHVERGGKSVAEVGPRTAKLGLAAHEIRPLEEALAKSMADLEMDPAGITALGEGRALTYAKKRVRMVRQKLGATTEMPEPVKIFERLTQRDDTAAGMLARVKAISPEQMPRVGRALFDEMLQEAYKSGSFKSALTDFKTIGPKTRDMLWGKAHADNIESLLTLADEMTRHINPSGSGMAGVKAAQIHQIAQTPLKGGLMAFAYGKLGEILTNPRATKVLLNGLKVPVRSPAAISAATLAVGRVFDEEGIR